LNVPELAIVPSLVKLADSFEGLESARVWPEAIEMVPSVPFVPFDHAWPVASEAFAPASSVTVPVLARVVLRAVM
jgi:hypothetical protein